MLVKTTEQSHFSGPKQRLVFCELVEHPGGHDGGEFPQYHEFTVTDDGVVLYLTDKPVCSNDSFVDEEYVHVFADNAKKALAFLKAELVDLDENRTRLQNLVSKLEAGAKFEQVLVCDEEDDEESDEG